MNLVHSNVKRHEAVARTQNIMNIGIICLGVERTVSGVLPKLAL